MHPTKLTKKMQASELLVSDVVGVVWYASKYVAKWLHSLTTEYWLHWPFLTATLCTMCTLSLSLSLKNTHALSLFSLVHIHHTPECESSQVWYL